MEKESVLISQFGEILNSKLSFVKSCNKEVDRSQCGTCGMYSQQEFEKEVTVNSEVPMEEAGSKRGSKGASQGSRKQNLQPRSQGVNHHLKQRASKKSPAQELGSESPFETENQEEFPAQEVSFKQTTTWRLQLSLGECTQSPKNQNLSLLSSVDQHPKH